MQMLIGYRTTWFRRDAQGKQAQLNILPLGVNSVKKIKQVVRELLQETKTNGSISTSKQEESTHKMAYASQKCKHISSYAAT